MAAPDRTITLAEIDENELLGLSPSDPAERVQATLEVIAARHKADWRDWQGFGAGALHSESMLAWLASRLESRGYEALVEFSFRTYFPTLHDPEAICWLFGHFADSIHRLAQLEAMSDEPEARRAKDRGCNAIASMIVAAGPSGARYALAAIDSNTFSRLPDWMARSWAIASADFEAAAIAEIAAVPERAGGSKRP